MLLFFVRTFPNTGRPPTITLLFRRLVQEVFYMRVIVTLACTSCKQRNYTTSKNKRSHPDRIELKKFCPYCNSHTAHRETR